MALPNTLSNLRSPPMTPEQRRAGLERVAKLERTYTDLTEQRDAVVGRIEDFEQRIHEVRSSLGMCPELGCVLPAIGGKCLEHSEVGK